MKDRHVEMDVMCELASEITEYIWDGIIHKNKPTNENPHTVEHDNGDIHYVEEAQNIFNSVLDMVDSTLNPEDLVNEEDLI